MKPRHTAALALLGWYLMVPPASDGRRLYHFFLERPGHYVHGKPFFPAPFWKWDTLGEFYSHANCESTRESIVRRDGKVERRPMAPDAPNATIDWIPNVKQYQANEATCIATEDPRLKER